MSSPHLTITDLEHTHITCMEFFPEDAAGYTRALVMYQDTRTPRTYATRVFQVQWHTPHHGKVCTLMHTYTIRAAYDTLYRPQIQSHDTDSYIILYQVGTEAPPTHASAVANHLHNSHRMMLHIQSQDAYQTLASDLSIALRRMIEPTERAQAPDPIREVGAGTPVNEMFWRGGYFYEFVTDALANKTHHQLPLPCIEAIHLPDIALPLDRAYASHIHTTWHSEEDTYTNIVQDPYYHQHTLTSYAIIPLHAMILPLILPAFPYPAPDAQHAIDAAEYAAIQRVRGYFRPVDIDPIIARMDITLSHGAYP